jgi:hypothetical protein
LIWPDSFSARLTSWNQLRQQVQHVPTESALTAINNWWFDTPWRPYYLHWDDQKTWPDPWQLLSDNVYCDVARGLGILYTITLLNRADMLPADLILTKSGHNLVLVAKEKYILNWEVNNIVNTNHIVTIQQQYQPQPIA